MREGRFGVYVNEADQYSWASPVVVAGGGGGEKGMGCGAAEGGGFMRMLPSASAREPFFLRLANFELAESRVSSRRATRLNSRIACRA